MPLGSREQRYRSCSPAVKQRGTLDDPVSAQSVISSPLRTRAREHQAPAQGRSAAHTCELQVTRSAAAGARQRRDTEQVRLQPPALSCCVGAVAATGVPRVGPAAAAHLYTTGRRQLSQFVVKRRATFTDCKAARHTAVRCCGGRARGAAACRTCWLGEARGRTSRLVAAGCGCDLQAEAARSQRGTRQEADLGLCSLAAGMRAAPDQTKARKCPPAHLRLC